jgi:hypothetical protein
MCRSYAACWRYGFKRDRRKLIIEILISAGKLIGLPVSFGP